MKSLSPCFQRCEQKFWPEGQNNEENFLAENQCIQKRQEWGDRLAKKARKQETDDITSLKSEIDKLTEMVKKLTEAKVGQT